MRAIRTEEKDTIARPGGRLAEGALSRGEKGALLEAELRRCWIEQWGQRGTRFTQSRTLQTELCRDPSLTVAFLLYLDVARRGSDFLKDRRQTSLRHTLSSVVWPKPTGRLHPQQARLSQLPEAGRRSASLRRSPGTWSKRLHALCWKCRPLNGQMLSAYANAKDAEQDADPTGREGKRNQLRNPDFIPGALQLSSVTTDAFFSLYFVLRYSRLNSLRWSQVARKGMQSHLHVSQFSPKLPFHPTWQRTALSGSHVPYTAGPCWVPASSGAMCTRVPNALTLPAPHSPQQPHVTECHSE